jgi:hypothetical protein
LKLLSAAVEAAEADIVAAAVAEASVVVVVLALVVAEPVVHVLNRAATQVDTAQVLGAHKLF